MEGCVACGLAKWERSASGRIRRSLAGRCQAPYPAVVLPACVEVSFSRRGIWPGDGVGCKTFQPAPSEAGGKS